MLRRRPGHDDSRQSLLSLSPKGFGDGRPASPRCSTASIATSPAASAATASTNCWRCWPNSSVPWPVRPTKERPAGNGNDDQARRSRSHLRSSCSRSRRSAHSQAQIRSRRQRQRDQARPDRPYSGPVSAYGTFGRASVAYFAMINEAGGINGRKINLLTSPTTASARPRPSSRRASSSNRTAYSLMFAPVGTSTNLAVRKYLNDRKVPAAPAAKRHLEIQRSEEFPVVVVGPAELRHRGARLRQAHPCHQAAGARWRSSTRTTISVRSISPASGRVWAKRARQMIVGEQSFELTDPTVESQVIALRGSGADVLLIVATQKQTVQALRKAHDLGWRPLSLIAFPAASISRTYVPAGIEASRARSPHRSSSIHRIPARRAIPPCRPTCAGWKNTIPRATSSTPCTSRPTCRGPADGRDPEALRRRRHAQDA